MSIKMRTRERGSGDEGGGHVFGDIVRRGD
jgi:hypothetical protein